MTLFLLAVLAAMATAFVLQPVFAASAGAGDESGGPASRDALRLTEKRDQLLLAIAELDFERDAGKVGATEHGAARAALLAEAATVTEALDVADAAEAVEAVEVAERQRRGPSKSPGKRRRTAAPAAEVSD